MKDFKMFPVPPFKTLKDVPMGSSCKGFHITETNAGWRVYRPVIDKEKCVGCYRCYFVCPDGAIHQEANNFHIDYDFCKGCGICAAECKPKAISMEKEGTQ